MPRMRRAPWGRRTIAVGEASAADASATHGKTRNKVPEPRSGGRNQPLPFRRAKREGASQPLRHYKGIDGIICHFMT